MGMATGTEPVPAAVRRLTGRCRAVPVWTNDHGGVTFRLEPPAESDPQVEVEAVPGPVDPQVEAETRLRFAKWQPRSSPVDLHGEAARMRWAAQYAVVPEVLEVGDDAEGRWLLTLGLDGETAVSDRWRAAPALAVPALGRALRHLHDALPVDGCPFDWGTGHRLARTVGDARALREPPPVDRLVVCHGDACSPNTLLREDASLAGHVDLATLGVADRWADLAVATMATTWNYGPGWEAPLLAAYGVEPDPVRTAYYRALWHAGP
ncbi:phosphotransferase [Kineococcus rubinsiae]|uniref:phosphotransferase n=1 Tax=Kineococcus rubinsiae TaxID=2609562 RepID=UPI00142F8623|nr:aminoglycoside 3'-phosphotransferase [Kineococcus rubinsiae]NIZ93565.1 aminoglycoside 3'-phosphotransferase [Kineococcus rubinsiae]